MAQVAMPTATADRTTFVGVIVPREIKALPKLLKGIDKPTFAAIVQREWIEWIDFKDH